MNKTKRTVLIASYLTAAFAVTAGFALKGYRQAAEYRLRLDNSYTHAYYELATAMSELNSALQKGRYVTTPVLMGTLCTDIYGKAVAAQMALGELPDSGVMLEQTAAFIARTGDYACALAKSVTSSGSCTEEQHQALQGLADTSSTLSSALMDLQSDLEGGSVSVADLVRAEQELADQAGDGGADSGGTSFKSIEADFPETPTLIYDGPFSEHLSNRQPLALEGLPQVARDEARSAAAEFLGLKPELFTLVSEGDGVLPAWGFSATVDGGELYVEVTRQGGKVLSLFTSRTAGAAEITPEQAVETARTFLSERGFGQLRESYYINQGNVLTINFAPVEGDVICYPDLIKVSVALDTGSVTGFECHGWMYNHTQRELETPAVSEQEAQAVLSSDLEVLSHQLALIPTEGEYEVLCHEFKCRTPQDTHVIVYVNAATGGEEKILLLLEDETGTLVL